MFVEWVEGVRDGGFGDGEERRSPPAVWGSMSRSRSMSTSKSGSRSEEAMEGMDSW